MIGGTARKAGSLPLAREDGGGAIESLIVFGDPLNGTAASDFLLSQLAGTINGLGGDDLILGDIGDLRGSISGNDSFASANDLDSNTDNWSTQENPLFADDSVPHMTLFVRGDGKHEYFKIVVGAGQTLTIDIDGAFGTLGSDTSTDTNVFLFAAGDLVNWVGTSDDSATSAGGYGSTGLRDSFLVFTNTGAAATYFIRIQEFSGEDNFETDDEFLLNVSLTGHAVSDGLPQNNDTIDGGAGDDHLFGAGGDDSLDGGTGADLMAGGTGNDTYFVNSNGDAVAEAGGEGDDIVQASLSYTLAAGASVETLATANQSGIFAQDLTGNEFSQSVHGNNAANTLRGEGRNDSLFGYGGHDTLIGGSGADLLSGGAGDDNYLVEDGLDQILEVSGEGYDTVYTFGDFALSNASAVEALTIYDRDTTNAAILFGNNLANVIYGNQGNNTLYGGGGTDTFYGLGGDDGYLVDDLTDQVFETAGQGYDTVYSTGDVALNNFSSIEALTVYDRDTSNALTLFGNNLDNVIYGNQGSNALLGGGGTDTFYGLGGDDRYFVDSLGDQVIEVSGAGSDTIYTTLGSYQLITDQSVETLTVYDRTTTNAVNLTGNNLVQFIYGNAGANNIDGKGGADTLFGMGGADTFTFTNGPLPGAADFLADFSAADDTIALDDVAFVGIGGPGALNPNAFVIGSQAGDAEDRIVYNQATGQLFFDADGNGADAQVLFATLNPGTALTAGDFTVI